MRDSGPVRPVDPNHRAYLEADEPWDADPEKFYRVKIVHPFWESITEELEYLSAVENTRDLLPSERMEAIRRQFGSGGVAKRMPYPRQTKREREAQLSVLRAQVDEADEPYWQK